MNFARALNRLLCDHFYQEIKAVTKDYGEVKAEGKYCAECGTVYWKDPFTGKFRKSN